MSVIQLHLMPQQTEISVVRLILEDAVRARDASRIEGSPLQTVVIDLASKRTWTLPLWLWENLRR